MIRVLFFARVKEELGCPGLELPWEEKYSDLDALQEQLCLREGDGWRAVLEQPNIIRALNQSVAEGNPALRDGDEVAFFPPVTGG